LLPSVLFVLSTKFNPEKDTTDMKIVKSTNRILLAALGLLTAGLPARAETITFVAELTGASEVPPSASTGTGTVTATVDSVSKSMTWNGSFSGLSGDATAAHFHGSARSGANAGVVVPIASFKSPFTGSFGLSDSQLADLAAGNWYVNIHTAQFPNGEIRGQVLPAN
jgi:hypothetical protein